MCMALKDRVFFFLLCVTVAECWFLCVLWCGRYFVQIKTYFCDLIPGMKVLMISIQCAWIEIWSVFILRLHRVWDLLCCGSSFESGLVLFFLFCFFAENILMGLLVVF